ncbi:MAG: alpha-glucosidase C-terminal domain-containing protein, partial [Clostridia bacterium]|nr:alpha-glucosidase C-terminal domain-containing protein [Clostridia bacterium]
KIRRENDAILYGDFELVSKQEDGNFIFTRTYEGKRFIVICNFEEEAEISVETNGKIVLSNYGRDTVSGIYRPYEVAIIEE